MGIKQLLLIASVSVAGCHTLNSSERTGAERQIQANAIADEAMKLEKPASQTALLVYSADHDSNRTVETIHAIHEARGLIIDDLRCADTPGYKASLAIVGSDGHPALQRDMSQGAYQSSGRSLDVAIRGPGFFKVKAPSESGLMFTRYGSFFINSQRELVLGLGDGYVVEPPIVVPEGATDINIDSGGKVLVIRPGYAVKSVVGQIQIVRFLSPESLHLEGGPLLSETPRSGPPEDGEGEILQGYLESSNTDLIRSRVRLRFLEEWERTLVETVDRSGR
ncbi:MAG TPA: flagellar hook basal-body protein [Tepidisphaeraceae bacterium]|nr:flagellar hook basal-body protein [Tepidisphaeraceae bacterium]